MPEYGVPNSPEMPHSETQVLPAEQYQAITLILAGKTFIEIAEKLGKDRHTLYRWRKNPHFLAEINRQRKEVYEAGQTRLQGLLHKAITVLERQLDEQNSLKAAMEVLRLLNATPKSLRQDFVDDPEAVAAKEAERMAYNAITATPFGQENMGIGAHRSKEVEVLASDIFEVLKEKYQIATALEGLA